MALTEEQNKIMAYALKGLTTIEIAEELGYSPSTVKKHLGRIYTAFNVKNKIALIRKMFILYSQPTPFV